MKASCWKIIYLQVRHCREALDHKWKMEVCVQGLNVFHGRRMNLAAHVTHDLHRKRPATPYNDRCTPESAWAHSMTYNPSLLSCRIEIDNKMLYWFPCLHSGRVLKTAHVHVWILTAVTTVYAAHTIAVAYSCISGSIWLRWYSTHVVHKKSVVCICILFTTSVMLFPSGAAIPAWRGSLLLLIFNN